MSALLVMGIILLQEKQPLSILKCCSMNISNSTQNGNICINGGLIVGNDTKTNFLEYLPESVLLLFFIQGKPFPRITILSCEKFRKAFLHGKDDG